MSHRHPTLPARRLVPASALALVVAGGLLSACAQPKTTASTTSSSLPGVPLSSTPTSAGAPTTAPLTAVTVTKPPACALSDTWGYAIIKATDPAQRGDATVADISASLDATASAIKTSVPANATDVDTRTELAKKVLGGATLTDEEKASEKASVDKLSAWYAATCG